MPTTESGKNWQKRNRDKARLYSAKYAATKKHISTYLSDWVVEEIDRVKEPGQTYGNWVRLHVENWALLMQNQSSH